jgi:hypothetical protein
VPGIVWTSAQSASRRRARWAAGVDKEKEKEKE